MQNNKWLNIVICVDESGSMYSSKDEVISGFNKIIDEQKANKDGKVTVSLYTFNDKVKECFVGKDVNEIDGFEYEPSSMTRMNDGIGMAITNVGKWLYEKDKRGEEMPGKTMFVLFTDGMENSSREYTLKQVQEMIKEQTEKYSWEFIYMGMDITTSKEADSLGFKWKTYSSKKNLRKNYDIINSVASTYRCMANTGASLSEASTALYAALDIETAENTKAFEKEIGQKISNV